jgi:nucleoside-diphosphate-sugar epimerase
MILKRPLITGAGGFIGAHLAKKLSALDEVECVYVVDLPNNSRIRNYANNGKFRVIECDLTDPNAIENLPDDPSVIFALAAMNGTGRFYTHPNTVLINSTIPSLSIFKRYVGQIPVVYSSSSEVYATTTELFGWATPTSEDVPISISDVHNPRWSYATAKLFGEVALTSGVLEYGGSGAIVRYHNVYGPDMGIDHFVPDFINRALKGEFRITGAQQTRAFMYIDDAVSGTIAAALNSNSDVPIYHLGSNEEITILNAAQIILQEMGVENHDIKLSPAPAGSVSRRCANTKKAELELGWKAQIDFSSGIKKYLEY